MADTQIGAAGAGHPNLNLTADEKSAYSRLLKEADPDGFGVVSGDHALDFFSRTSLSPDMLGQIWQIADSENNGFLTAAGFGVVLRLIGHAQAGRSPTPQLATQVAPLPRFSGSTASQPAQPVPPPVQQQPTGPPQSPTGAPIRVPPLSPDKVAEYSGLFERSDAENGMLSGVIAKQIFERARLPNDVLGRIWGLSDTQGRGALDVTEFVIAMHLLASFKSGQMRGVPNTLPPGLYEAALRRPPPVGQRGPGSRPGSAQPQIAPQFSGYGRPQSPITRAQAGTPLSQQSTGEMWLINAPDKAKFDQIFATIDKSGSGYISGGQAVEFFGNARLPEEVLAQIWDLSDINSEGRLDRDEFAVAMYLIRQQRGSKDGRGILPQSLPPALIPPSKRKQHIPPSQPTAPAFENAAPTKPKSAADDLFGLDAFGPPGTPQQQVAQSTGGTDAGPFANPPAPSSPSTSTQFRPFVPTSSFGQSLNPQATGSPSLNQNRSIASPSHDDLLGDADPAETSKITNETTELANLSNQVGNLSKQMTDLHTSRGQTEQEINQTSAQKRAFESRLGQLRQLYESEVKEVKALKDQLAAVKGDTKRLQSDYAMINGNHQDLSTQHQQLRQQFETDQRENAALKEKIRQMNAEVDSLKPQLEKLKSDARQQKGLVAINKKQLATNEAERDRLKAELTAAQKEIEDHAREAVESARAIENSKREVEEAERARAAVKSPPAVASPPAVTSPPAVSRDIVSPAPSTSSNPFFRRTPSETVASPEPQPQQQHNQSAFDNIFGPSFGAAAPAPATSFDRSFDSANDTPPAGISRASSSTPQIMEPPAPPSASQITSAALPFPHSLSRNESVNSSVRVAAPASRLSPEEGNTPRALTPGSSTYGTEDSKADDPFAPSAQDEEQESVKQTIPTGEMSTEEMFGKSTENLELPGAFPGGDTPGVQTPTASGFGTGAAIGAGAAAVAAGVGVAAATNGEDKGKGPAKEDDDFDQYFAGAVHQRSASDQARDFDSAFAGMKAAPAANGASNQEFPDIKELEDSDSESESSEEPAGFDDDFNKSKAAEAQPAVASAVPSHLAPRPQIQQTPSAASSLPDFSTQTPPPPDYQNAAGSNPNHFAREYAGLLPEREDPTSPPPAGGETVQQSAPEAHSYGPEVGHAQNAGASPPPPAVAKSTPFDFDSAFAGVGPAQVEDDSDSDDEDDVPHNKRDTAQFDPTFDSPAPSSTTAASSSSAAATVPPPSFNTAVTNGSATPPPPPAKNDFFDFGTDKSAGPVPPAGPSPGTGNPQTAHDWDDIFSGLSSSNNSAPKTVGFEEPEDGETTPTAETQATAISPTALALTKSREVPPTDSPLPERAVPVPPPRDTAATTPPLAKTNTLTVEGAGGDNRPNLARAISTTSEHDDPIVKMLTGMGFNRADSVAALEKYDYDIDKAADYLTFRD
ncbi:putative calcium-binding protein [Cyphellophora attinorum]|uniref:Actin cytoskeleton-regulatory complex protein END3 n=1 Tax=Cyphellophora attinorum TaxID=1664694 RepID=A0A0N1HBP4_9EURO|nr:putative calcium-binding protein [Phialophora attinorum]KPI41820.1 putative calcium-binding protein [Phialophora attinorum]